MSTNLVADPGFETPTVRDGELTRYPTTYALGGWTVVGADGTVDLLEGSFTYEGYTFQAQAGRQSLDLTGNSETRTGVAQSVATHPGQQYTLTFFVGNVVDPGSDLGSTSKVLVSINGKQVTAAKNAAGAGQTMVTWKKFSVPFTATGSKTALKLINGDPSDDTADLIDTIRVT